MSQGINKVRLCFEPKIVEGSRSDVSTAAADVPQGVHLHVTVNFMQRRAFSFGRLGRWTSDDYMSLLHVLASPCTMPSTGQRALSRPFRWLGSKLGIKQDCCTPATY